LTPVPPLATGSSSACASDPSGVESTTVVVTRDFPRWVPRYGGSDLLPAMSAAVVHLGDPSSVCAPACFGSRPHLQCATQTAVLLASARTSGRARSPPSPRTPSLRAL